ncbi:hypothetical protein ACXYMO_01870 [Arenibacterium sp. CAU 1754]
MTDGWGDHYSEFWVGIGSALPEQVKVTVRNAPKVIFFYGPLGLVTVEKIETLEFDGWEIFDGFQQSVVRFESMKDAKSNVLKIFDMRIKEILERGEDPEIAEY